MSVPGNRANDASVASFIDGLEDEQQREDCLELVRLMSEITGAEPRMWGDSMVGFDSYHYVYASGREGDWFITGFSPRRRNLSIYVMPGFSGVSDLMGRLGKHRTGKSCLYAKRLGDLDRTVLRELLERSVAEMRDRYPDG